jgi:hypothetical protein
MFTFHWIELLVVIVCGLALFLGLAFLMLRRRNEILQTFLTPEEPHLEEEFFRVRTPKQDEPPQEETAEPEPHESVEEETADWGQGARSSG